jgi:uncharacterized protein YfkK (UPF0435 family)
VNITHEQPCRDEKEAQLELLDEQTRQIADLCQSREVTVFMLEEVRGQLGILRGEYATVTANLEEANEANRILLEHVETLNDQAYNALNEIAQLVVVIRETLFPSERAIGALIYLKGIVNYKREKFHAPNFGDDIPF